MSVVPLESVSSPPSPGLPHPNACAYNLVIQWLVAPALRTVYRDIRVVQAPKGYPRDCGVMLIANHNNLFIDGQLLALATPVPLTFLVAAITYRKHCLDRTFAGTGTASAALGADGTWRLAGAGTRFDAELAPGARVALDTGAQYLVSGVDSASSATLKPPRAGAEHDAAYADAKAEFKVIPFLDQGAVFDGVASRLAAGGTVCVFPEGRSTDTPGLQPFKGGAASMALQGAAVPGGRKVVVVPSVLRYQRAELFRSRACVEFGDPIEVPADLAAKAAAGGKDAADASKALTSLCRAAMADLMAMPSPSREVNARVRDLRLLAYETPHHTLIRPRQKAAEYCASLHAVAEFHHKHADETEGPYVELTAAIAAHEAKALALLGPTRRCQLSRASGWTNWPMVGGFVLLSLVLFVVALPGLVAATVPSYLARRAGRSAAIKDSRLAHKTFGHDADMSNRLIVGGTLTVLFAILYALAGAVCAAGLMSDHPHMLYVAPLVGFVGLPAVALCSLPVLDVCVRCMHRAKGDCAWLKADPGKRRELVHERRELSARARAMLGLEEAKPEDV